MADIHYYFWMNSDWAYLGADRLDAIARRHGIGIQYRPVDLPSVYSRTGGVLLGQRAAERQAYRIAELKRWCRKLGIHVNPKPAYMCPDASLASCIVIAADRMGAEVYPLYKAILRAEWSEERDISSVETLHAILAEQQLDGSQLIALAQEPEIAQAYRRYTEEAIGHGVFGSPSYLYHGELFWGQDRLEMLEEAIVASR